MSQTRRKILYRTARSYVIVSEKLECGHQIDVLPNDELTAKYRHCQLCAEALPSQKPSQSVRPVSRSLPKTSTG